jgi:hypothetical protein
MVFGGLNPTCMTSCSSQLCTYDKVPMLLLLCHDFVTLNLPTPTYQSMEARGRLAPMESRTTGLRLDTVMMTVKAVSRNFFFAGTFRKRGNFCYIAINIQAI